MVYIGSAFLGDEVDSRDITQVLRDKIVGTNIKVPVDSKLIPAFATTNKTSITKQEEKKIQAAAQRVCGGPDQACMDSKVAEMTQQVLIAKSQNAQSGANTVKGRRLTVNVVGENNFKQRLVIPEGQLFELNGLSPLNPKEPPGALPSFGYIRTQFIDFAGVTVSTFIWVFSIVATYALFSRMGWGYIAWVLTAIAFVLPGSGYVIIFGYFIIQSFVDKYTSMV